MKKYLCIYHGNCADGFGAAWVVRKALGEENVEFHAGVYGNEPPNVEGRDVILVDFSYKRPVLLQMAETANSILIIDHHKTAASDLTNISQAALEYGVCPIRAVFDMEYSGAMLTWQFYFHDEQPPVLLKHIEDRDLWRFKIKGTRQIQANLFSYPYDFEVWDELMEKANGIGWDMMYKEGAAIERKHFKDIKEFINVAQQIDIIAGYIVPVLNAPYFWSSDAGQIMCDSYPFAACYWDTPTGRVYSLRSDENGVDVSIIAALFGGGGHKHASGFRLAYDDLHKLRKEK